MSPILLYVQVIDMPPTQIGFSYSVFVLCICSVLLSCCCCRNRCVISFL